VASPCGRLKYRYKTKKANNIVDPLNLMNPGKVSNDSTSLDRMKRKANGIDIPKYQTCSPGVVYPTILLLYCTICIIYTNANATISRDQPTTNVNVSHVDRILVYH